MLIKCPECGKEISDKASVCLNCGCPINNIIKPKKNFVYYERPKGNLPKRENKKTNIALIIFAVIACLFIIFAVLSEPIEETNKEIEETEQFTNDDNVHKNIVMEGTVVEELQTEEVSSETIMAEEDLESEYKKNCSEMWYNDIFFSEENLKGENVKLYIYTEEKKFFTNDSIYNSVVSEFIKEHDLHRDILACGVKREDSDSYVGGQINLYFSNKYNYLASDYETGEELIIYGEIVDYSTYTWDGYNVCGIVPRYIEHQ